MSFKVSTAYPYTAKIKAKLKGYLKTMRNVLFVYFAYFQYCKGRNCGICNFDSRGTSKRGNVSFLYFTSLYSFACCFTIFFRFWPPPPSFLILNLDYYIISRWGNSESSYDSISFQTPGGASQFYLLPPFFPFPLFLASFANWYDSVALEAFFTIVMATTER